MLSFVRLDICRPVTSGNANLSRGGVARGQNGGDNVASDGHIFTGRETHGFFHLKRHRHRSLYLLRLIYSLQYFTAELLFRLNY